MLKKSIYIFILLAGSLTMGQAKTNTLYYMQMKAHLMYCEVRLNDMYLFNTLQQTRDIPEFITMGQQISEYINQGKNNITLRADNVSIDLTSKEIETGYCEIIITEQTYNADTFAKESSRVLSNIRATYKKQKDGSDPAYELTIENSQRVDNVSTQEVTLIGSTSLTEDDYATKTYGQLINIPEAYPFSWIHQSTPITNTKENKKLVWDKYMEIKQAILKKDKVTIKNIARIGMTDVANYQKDNVDNHFNIVFGQLLQSYFDFDPDIWISENLSMDDFNLEIYADGKLFRLVEKDAYISSPLSWKNKYTKMYRSYNPLFTMINGEIVMATF